MMRRALLVVLMALGTGCTARQAVVAEEVKVERTRTQELIAVQEQEVLRKQKELEATVIKPAEADRQAAVTRAEAMGMEYNIVEAIDQPWKFFEGGVGPYWGILDANRVPKFSWTGPIVTENYWKLAAILEGVFARYSAGQSKSRSTPGSSTSRFRTRDGS